MRTSAMPIWVAPERYLTTAGGKEWLKVPFEEPQSERAGIED
jgi:hypothetical protein